MAKKLEEKVTFGSSNVFADLGYPDAEERQTKLRLAHAIDLIVQAKGLSQSGAAELLEINQPKVSALLNCKLAGFSVERLMMFLTALDCDVDIVIRKKARVRASGRIAVLTA